MASEKLTLLKGDVSNEARKMVNPKAVNLKGSVFKATFEMDKKLAEKLDTDARFVAKLYDDITKDYKALIPKVALIWKEADNMASIMPLTDKENKEYTGQIAALFKETQAQVDKKANAHVDKWLKVQKDRTKYKKSVAWNITTGTLSIASSGATIGLGMVTGGASLVLTIVTAAKGIYRIAKEIKRIAADVEKAQTQLQGTVASLMKSYENKGKWGVGVSETGKAAVQYFLEYEAKTITLADKQMVTYRGKLKPIYDKTSSLGKDLHALLDAQTKLDKQVNNELDKLLKKSKRKSKNVDKLVKATEVNQKQVQALLKSLTDMNGVLNDHERFTKEMETALKQLHSKETGWGKAAKWAVYLVSFAANPAITAIATRGESLEKGVELLSDAYGAVKDELGG